MQNNNIPCYAFEVNPLMYLIARVKLENNYDVNRIIFWHDYIKNSRDNMQVVLQTAFSTLYEDENKKSGIIIPK